MNLKAPGSILLISCYELGHQPHGLAVPLAFLSRSRFVPETLDLAVELWDEKKVQVAQLVAISVPMHTALRIGVRAVERVRRENPTAIICLYGLYAALNAEYLLEHGADYCLGAESAGPLVDLATRLGGENCGRPNWPPALGQRLVPPSAVPAGGDDAPWAVRKRQPDPVPVRDRLPPLDRYARLEYAGTQQLVAYVEASRGCRHLCRHCPIPPIYGGRFLLVSMEAVLEDIRQQVASGARHVTFGDPDFLNGPGHSLKTLRALHREFPDVTFDFTAKVEHIVKHARLFPELAQLGCLFVVSAVESLNTRVLEILAKGHTRDDVKVAIDVCRQAGIALRPTWVPFTPWGTRTDYVELLDFVSGNDLIDHVDPVQYSIRLLVPPGSMLVNHPSMAEHLIGLDGPTFSYRWNHPDPEMDTLQRAVAKLVSDDGRSGIDVVDTFRKISAMARAAEPTTVDFSRVVRLRAPRLTEPWFC